MSNTKYNTILCQRMCVCVWATTCYLRRLQPIRFHFWLPFLNCILWAEILINKRSEKKIAFEFLIHTQRLSRTLCRKKLLSHSARRPTAYNSIFTSSSKNYLRQYTKNLTDISSNYELSAQAFPFFFLVLNSSNEFYCCCRVLAVWYCVCKYSVSVQRNNRNMLLVTCAQLLGSPRE